MNVTHLLSDVYTVMVTEKVKWYKIDKQVKYKMSTRYMNI